MKTFKEFFFEVDQEKKQIMDSSQANMILRIDDAVANLPDNISSLYDNDFSKNIANILQKKEFIEELSNHISTPRPEESEDDFVKRASMQMRNLLENKFSNS